MKSFQSGVVRLVLLVLTLPLSALASPPEDALSQEMQQLRQHMAQQQQRLEQMQNRLDQVENENALLRRQTDQSWLTERRAEEVKTLIREVLADAETRASLLEDDLTAGWKDGFFLASEDGKFLLRLFGQLQVRHVLNTADNAQDNSEDPDEDLDDTVNGFEMTRVRIGFKGHIFDPSWKYFIWQGYNWDGSALLLDAYITKVLGGGWSVSAGQFKTPLLREWLVSETRQQFIERSLIAGCLCGHYTQGAMLDYKGDRVHGTFSINDGLVGINSQWTDEDVEALGLTGRVEWIALGPADWKRYADFESFRGEEMMLVLGAAGHWQQGEYGTSGSLLSNGDEAEIIRWTLDAHLELGGANVFVAFVANHLSEAENVPDLDQYGLVVQGGVFVTEDTELIARYEWGDNDVDGCDTLSLVTVGVNKFFHGHALKLTTDVGYAFNSLQRVDVGGNTFGWPAEFHGYQPESDSSDGQIVWRTQLQLLF